METITTTDWAGVINTITVCATIVAIIFISKKYQKQS